MALRTYCEMRPDSRLGDRDALLRARGAVTGRDAELFASIGEAVREELAQVKDTLDMELRTGRVDREQREGSKTSLRQLADTLNMLDLPVAAKAVENLLPELEATALARLGDLRGKYSPKEWMYFWVPRRAHR